MNNEVKFYITYKGQIENLETLKKMLSIISHDAVKIKKTKDVIETYNVTLNGFLNLAVSLRPLKNDLKLDELSFIVTPIYNDDLLVFLNNDKSEVSYLIDLILRKTKENKTNYNCLKKLFVNINGSIIETVKQYIRLNQSIDKTSKVMFTHRNTINYRINRFIALTGINIRELNNAMFTYVVLQIIEM